MDTDELKINEIKICDQNMALLETAGDYDDEDDIAGFEDDMPSDGDGDERPSGP